MTTVPESRSRGRTLRERCIGRTESTVVGVASTAPAYSLAVTVGLLVAYVGVGAPLVLLIAVIPIIGVALCFRELNLSEPDCGTVFAWTQRAFGVNSGRMVGWISIMACVFVMGNLAQVASIYAYELVGAHSAAHSRGAQALLGTAFIAVLAYLAYRGIEVAARVQAVLLTGEVLVLFAFAGAAIGKSDSGSVPSFSTHGHGSWGLALLAAVFLYWGWDSSFSMNEESEDPRRTPAFGALAANAVLVFLYVVVTWAALSYAGVDKLAGIKEGDFFTVLGGELMSSFGGKALIGMVLFSALASTQTTILPTARTMLSMARQDAFPGRFARISRRYRTPSVSTVVFAAVSTVIYVTLVLISDSVLRDSVASISVLVSIYYLATALAVPAYFIKQELETSRPFPRMLQRVWIPVATAAAFVVILCLAISEVTGPTLLVIVITLLVGAILMFSMKPPVEEKVTA